MGRYVVKGTMGNNQQTYFTDEGAFCTDISHAKIYKNRFAASRCAIKQSKMYEDIEVVSLKDTTDSKSTSYVSLFAEYAASEGINLNCGSYGVKELKEIFDAGIKAERDRTKQIILEEMNKQEKSPKAIFEEIADDKLDTVITMLGDISVNGKGFQYYWVSDGGIKV